MKTLPRWMVGTIIASIVIIIIASVSQFAEKSLVYVQGEISITPELEQNAENIRTLFIVLFDEDSPMPMPYGAYREHLSISPKGKFSRFTLTKDNLQIMNPDNPHLPKNLRVKFRLDSNGSAGKDKMGDLVGELRNIKLGSTGLTARINTLIQ